MTDVAAVTSFYGRWARLYDLLARRTPGIGSLRAAVADALALEPGDTAVDMGCGTGATLPFLRERIAPTGRVIGIDLTPGMLAAARAAIAGAGWDNVHLVRGDAARPPVEGPVDGLAATFVVGMLDDPAAAVEEWCDRVAPGGRVVLLDATRSPRPVAAPLNAAFAAFVAATAPPTCKLRYDEPPAATLDARVTGARAALADRGEIVRDERHALGFVRLTAARV